MADAVAARRAAALRGVHLDLLRGTCEVVESATEGFPEELDHLADRLDRVHAQAGGYPAGTDGSVAALGQGTGPGR